MYTPVWHIATISQKLYEGKDLVHGGNGPCKIRIVHPEVEVRPFDGVA